MNGRGIAAAMNRMPIIAKAFLTLHFWFWAFPQSVPSSMIIQSLSFVSVYPPLFIVSLQYSNS